MTRDTAPVRQAMGRSTHSAVRTSFVELGSVSPIRSRGITMTMRLWVAAQSRLYSEQGASLVEYALLLTLIAVVAIGAIQLIGNQVTTNLNKVGGDLGGTPGTSLVP